MYIHINEDGLMVLEKQDFTCKHTELQFLIGKVYVDLRNEFSDKKITVWCNDEKNYKKKYKHSCTLPDGTKIYGNVVITGWDEDDDGNQEPLTEEQIELVKKEITLA